MPRLRIVATSDLHAAAWPFDYFADRPSPAPSLAGAAAAIAAARREADLAVLLDNGDLLQGAPLGDGVAAGGLADGRAHPLHAALAAIGCEAAGLGNHEFNYGLPFLEAACAAAPFPFVCANVARADGAPLLAPFVLLERRLAGAPLTIGVTGVVPPQVTLWDRSALAGRVVARDVVDALEETVPAMRAAGADVVVVLAHTGIAPPPRRGGDENAALHLAGIPGIDAIVLGHLHRVFPGGRDFVGVEGVEPERGLLRGVPAAMPGAFGSHVAILDLELERRGDAWRVVGARAEARAAPAPPDPAAPAAAAVLAATRAAHEAARLAMSRPVGEALAPLDTFFVALGEDRALALVAAAQRAAVAREIAGTPLERLPLLSAAAPFAAGGRGGPGAYVDIPAGPLAMREIAALYPYPNAVAAVRTTGAELAEWLERAAGLYATLDPTSSAPQELVDPLFPPYHFDMVAGVTYVVDPTAPPRYDRDGELVAPQARRVRGLSYRGRPVRPDDVFLVATNGYRAGGGGRFCGGRLETALETTALVRDVLAAHVAGASPLAFAERMGWRLADPPPGVVAILRTSPAAAGREPPAHALEDLGLDPDGFRAYAWRGPRARRPV